MKVNLKNVAPATWVRIVALLLVLTNQIALSVFNFQLIPFTDEEIYEAVSTVITLVISLLSAWKNNSFTPAAQEADALLKQKKGVK